MNSPSEASTTVRRQVASLGAVAVIDTSTHTVTTEFVLTDFFISGVAISPDGQRAYVANTGNDDVVTVLDTASNTVVGRIPMAASIGVAVAPDGKRLYVQISGA